MAGVRKPRLMTTIDLSGPFFTNDPAKTFRANGRSMLRQMALEGARDIRAQLLTGESSRRPVSAQVPRPRVSSHVAAGIPYTPEGKNRYGSAIQVNVYVPNFGYSKKQAQALMAAYSNVERETGAFARTTRRMKKSRAVNVAELLKDIA